MEIQPNALDKQEGGDHYKNMAIQPVEFITKNKLGFCEGNIIKYACRHKHKDGIKDVKKIIHYAELLKDMEYAEDTNTENWAKLKRMAEERKAGMDTVGIPQVKPTEEGEIQHLPSLEDVVSGFGIYSPEQMKETTKIAYPKYRGEDVRLALTRLEKENEHLSRKAQHLEWEYLKQKGGINGLIRERDHWRTDYESALITIAELKEELNYPKDLCGSEVNYISGLKKKIEHWKHRAENAEEQREANREAYANAATLELVLVGLKAELKEVKAERHALELKNDELRSLIGVGCINKDWKLNEDFDKIIESGLQAIERLKATCINKSCTYYTFASKQEIDSIYIAFKRMNNCCENLLKNNQQKHPGEGITIPIGDAEADALRLQEQIKKHNESKEKDNKQ